MAAEFIVRPTRPGDAEELLEFMRAEDLLECEAVGLSAQEAVGGSIQDSLVCVTILIHGRVAAITGVGDGPSGAGLAWCLSTSAVESSPRAYLVATRRVLGVFRGLYPELLAAVDPCYRGAVRWLEWLGFERIAVAPVGPKQAIFYVMRIQGKE